MLDEVFARPWSWPGVDRPEAGERRPRRVEELVTPSVDVVDRHWAQVSTLKDRCFPNLPNVLTLLRILAVPVIVVALLGETPNGDALAAGVFALAASRTASTATSRDAART